MNKAFVLLSGGIDSSTCLGIAIEDAKRAQDGRAIEAISINYGQRHSTELKYAEKVAAHYGVPHRVLVLPKGQLGGMLTDVNEALPDCDYADIVGVSPTYVSFRNGTMLSLLAAEGNKFTQVNKGEHAYLYYGAHAEDAAGFAYPSH